ncbi:hypothetical protein KIL84_003994 [Mauremys mutica]|uniref:Uncharacterized protein n=1 Tax=Mauremys mutica TaxID=74926 RepID=A0A9D4AU14_9SAUR|nr:hypothetical protein KIL84_003994 [Mauremys mutica]
MRSVFIYEMTHWNLPKVVDKMESCMDLVPLGLQIATDVTATRMEYAVAPPTIRLGVMTRKNVKAFSTRTPAATVWWRRPTPRKPARSVVGWVNYKST